SLCVHEPHADPEWLHAHITPIAATTTYAYEDPEHLRQLFTGERSGYVYSRWSNPTVVAAEEKLATLEACGLCDDQGQPLRLKARLFGSGMAAISTLMLAFVGPGRKIVTQHNLYGGSHELLLQVLRPLGIDVVMLHLKDLAQVERELQQNAALLYVETPSNPTLECYDLASLAALARSCGVPMAVDNTFATPLLQQPLACGANAVVYSATKFLNGHGNAVTGALIFHPNEELEKRVFMLAKLLGNNSNAFEAWLLLNGLKTLAVRMERHCRNALQVATLLHRHPAVQRVYYPGLPDHPDHPLVRRQMKDFGAMISFELRGGWSAARKFLQRLRLCRMAVSLGTTDTLVQHPASMSHAGVDPDLRRAAGITDGLVRMSVGLEDANDLAEDLTQALNAAE
ncbi:MAG: aminotransferase class I/II-fold pyridoxal phosphate-dependent enzyme, partial [Chitinophagales bacterium]|nr:aminotransferase class I/II-fold pyridoxal phosphate-dependent enzyme [Chitinophagales bacterium]